MGRGDLGRAVESAAGGRSGSVSPRKAELKAAGLAVSAYVQTDDTIGSGAVESAHRYVIQKRLKIARAWWKQEQAQNMLALRVCRANQNWAAYWAQSTQKAA